AAFAALEDRVLKRVLAGGPGAADHGAPHEADNVRPVGQIRWAV
ncbi:aliphatic sulfonate ABC transporter ATP-binding protein, partial [Burkholderia sp. Ac-20392]|nr:aliphatic sulfonate ABC transporter ATP-binding protein [Burkholderia sp. Ac-20392]